MDIREVLADMQVRSRNHLWLELERRQVDIDSDAKEVFGRMTEGDISRIPKIGSKSVYDIQRTLKKWGIILIPVNKQSKIAIQPRGNT